jgi:hypothetical protein
MGDDIRVFLVDDLNEPPGSGGTLVRMEVRMY